MSQKRTPRGVPTGGEFAGNEHDEASAGLDVSEDRLNAEDLDIGDTIDLTRNVLDSNDAAKLEYLGSQQVVNVTGKTRAERLIVMDSTGVTREWDIAADDTFDRTPPRPESYQVVEPGELDEGDLVDMTRTIDEYVSNPYRGGGDGIDSARDLAALRGRVFRIDGIEDDGEGGYDLTMVSTGESEPEERFSWWAFSGVSDFDLVPRDEESPMRETF